ncbi:MAG: glycosyltransferase [Candidatus Electrothrix sp. AR4]|nr:glycosyltransferase [Candidatus Electrothrix sp. AR4]
MIRNIFKKIEEYLAKRKVERLNTDTGSSHPCFSVVIPIYDRTVKLREAVDSLLCQSFINFEVLLVCDGSPPETREVVKSYLAHPKVRAFFFQDNSGNPCRGRNKGIEMAHGRFVAFLDSDDIATPDRLERTLYHLLTKKVDVVGGAIQYLTEGEHCRAFKNGQIGFTSEECTYDLLLQGNRLSICTVAVRKECLLRFGAFRKEMRYREDHELWLRLAYHDCSFYNSPEVFAQYRVHACNAELSYLAEDKKWQEKTLELHRQRFSF